MGASYAATTALNTQTALGTVHGTGSDICKKILKGKFDVQD